MFLSVRLYKKKVGLPFRIPFPVGVFPYRGILDFHAKLSSEKAIRKGWIAKTETVVSFFDLSLDASVPDLDQYEFIETLKHKNT